MLAKPNWQTILADGYTDPQKLLHDLGLPEIDVSAHRLFRTRVPKPFADKIEPNNPNDPLLLQVLPIADEFTNVDGFVADPLAEQQFNPISGLLHKYQSRVLLTFQGACAINCRYCFRRHFDYADNHINAKQLEKVIDYIKQHSHINEVILSGGDPLMAKDKTIQTAIEAFETLPQLKRLRIHTRLPIVIPERITDDLVQMLTKTYLRTVMVLHCNHPNEIDEHFAKHIRPLTDNGVQLLNQSVLLKGVNDNADTLAELSEKLFDYRIMPYYLFMLDKVSGAAHFNVEEHIAQQLIRDMAAQLPGYLVPKLTRETAGMTSKDMWV
ncbi:MAG: EF-P beta-lysylation protein EpmB [Gammaproteobacteria bacterium]|nr:EF-P beta-lysylation protein EpmB [Gammaproteobacteria bacterium]